jgi:hypothetical protein
VCVNATPLPVVLRNKARGGEGERVRAGSAATRCWMGATAAEVVPAQPVDLATWVQAEA